MSPHDSREDAAALDGAGVTEESGGAGALEQPTQVVRDLFGLSFPAIAEFARILRPSGLEFIHENLLSGH